MVLKIQRLPTIVVAFIAYIALMLMSCYDTLSFGATSPIYFVVSAFSAFSFLAIVFVWLYARDRRIAFLLLVFVSA